MNEIIWRFIGTWLRSIGLQKITITIFVFYQVSNGDLLQNIFNKFNLLRFQRKTGNRFPEILPEHDTSRMGLSRSWIRNNPESNLVDFLDGCWHCIYILLLSKLSTSKYSLFLNINSQHCGLIVVEALAHPIENYFMLGNN